MRKDMVKNMLYEGLAVLLILFIGGAFDLHKKRIPWWIFGAGLIMSILILLISEDIGILNRLLALIPGLILLLTGFVTRQQIGYGDGIIVLLTGLMVGIKNCLSILVLGFGLIFVFSIFLLLIKKIKKKHRIPFVPFLFLAQCILLLTTTSKTTQVLF